jgi:hypothetical protein
METEMSEDRGDFIPNAHQIFYYAMLEVNHASSTNFYYSGQAACEEYMNATFQSAKDGDTVAQELINTYTRLRMTENL